MLIKLKLIIFVIQIRQDMKKLINNPFFSLLGGTIEGVCYFI